MTATSITDMNDGGASEVTCLGCARFSFLPKDSRDSWCRPTDIPEEKIRGLEVQISTLNNIREDKVVLDNQI